MGDLNKFKNSYWLLKLKEIKHRLTYVTSNERMAISMERYKKCENKKPIRQIKSEIKLCKKYWGCYPLHYFRYDLYRKDKQLSGKELINYIPEFFFYRIFLPYHDSNKYAVLIDEKNITEQIFRSLGINQPKALYKIINNNLYNIEMKNQNYLDFKLDLEVNKYPKIFVKPSNGQGGNGIYVFHRRNNGIYKTKLEEELNKEFLDELHKKGDYIFQLAVNQNKNISSIYPDSVNTFRIATENKMGSVRILCATLRVGKMGNEVDNGSQNGLVLGINIDTGKIKEFAVTEEGEKFYNHSDTGFEFRNFKIPEWARIKEFTMDSARKLPQFTYLGWDIALGEEGPLAIETNMNFGLDHYQISIGGLKDIFLIDNPDFYWENKGVFGR